jgi:hypothetical protein
MYFSAVSKRNISEHKFETELQIQTPYLISIFNDVLLKPQNIMIFGIEPGLNVEKKALIPHCRKEIIYSTIIVILPIL